MSAIHASDRATKKSSTTSKQTNKKWADFLFGTVLQQTDGILNGPMFSTALQSATGWIQNRVRALQMLQNKLAISRRLSQQTLALTVSIMHEQTLQKRVVF